MRDVKITEIYEGTSEVQRFLPHAPLGHGKQGKPVYPVVMF